MHSIMHMLDRRLPLNHRISIVISCIAIICIIIIINLYLFSYYYCVYCLMYM